MSDTNRPTPRPYEPPARRDLSQLVTHLLGGDIEEASLAILGDLCPTPEEFQHMDPEVTIRLAAAATVAACLAGVLDPGGWIVPPKCPLCDAPMAVTYRAKESMPVRVACESCGITGVGATAEDARGRNFEHIPHLVHFKGAVTDGEPSVGGDQFDWFDSCAPISPPKSTKPTDTAHGHDERA